MPFAHPTLTELRTQAIQDVTTSGVPGLNGLLRNAVLRVLAWVMAGLAYEVYGFIDWISREAVPFTATDEYLIAWAALVDVHRLDATAAAGSALFTGITGTVLPAGTALTMGGTPYATTAEGVVDSLGNVVVPIVAGITGSLTNAADGMPINIATPIAGINSTGATSGPLTAGADQETDDQLRTRMLVQYAAPPHGGAATDYIEWATTVPGCTRAWVKPQAQGPGTVVVFVMFDTVNASTGGFPIGTDGSSSHEYRANTATGDQLLVADAIWPVQPVTALVYVVSPLAMPINIVLTDLAPNTIEQQQIIIQSLDDMMLQKGELEGTLYPSDIYEAVSQAPGVQHFVVVTPTEPVTAGTGQLPVLGTLSVV